MTPRFADRPERKQVLLRLGPSVHAVLAHWVADSLQSVNAQIEYLLRDTLKRADRLPDDAAPMRRPGCPPELGPGRRPSQNWLSRVASVPPEAG